MLISPSAPPARSPRTADGHCHATLGGSDIPSATWRTGGRVPEAVRWDVGRRTGGKLAVQVWVEVDALHRCTVCFQPGDPALFTDALACSACAHPPTSCGLDPQAPSRRWQTWLVRWTVAGARSHQSKGPGRPRAPPRRSPAQRRGPPWCSPARQHLAHREIRLAWPGWQVRRWTANGAAWALAPVPVLRPVQARRWTRAGTARLTIGSNGWADAVALGTAVGRLKISIRACVSKVASNAPAAVPVHATQDEHTADTHPADAERG